MYSIYVIKYLIFCALFHIVLTKSKVNIFYPNAGLLQRSNVNKSSAESMIHALGNFFFDNPEDKFTVRVTMLLAIFPSISPMY